MRIIEKIGREDIALVYLAKFDNYHIEFVESLEPPIPREKKWVLIVSSLFGCPVGCQMCDAGGSYKGKLSTKQILSQIDFLITKRFPDRKIDCEKFKIQFARIGEPSYNNNVLEVLKRLPEIYDAPGLMPCISSVAPQSRSRFFEKLLKIKNDNYPGRFQLQFSIHTTDSRQRSRLIPVKLWDFNQIAEYGKRFVKSNDRKITLNFALSTNSTVDPNMMLEYFDPDYFLVKITPLNPTYMASQNRLKSYIDIADLGKNYEIVDMLRACGYDVIVSIGELEENAIGSNCGQYIQRHLDSETCLKDGYLYSSHTKLNRIIK